MNKADQANEEKFIIGNLENINLPDLGIRDLQARIDTGAKTSSLHVDNMSRYKKAGKPWVRFDIHPNIHKVEEIVTCEAPLQDIRRVKSSNGTVEERYLIVSNLQIGGRTWPIEITLTNRSDMSYLMLLGREGMKDKVLVDPCTAFLLS